MKRETFYAVMTTNGLLSKMDGPDVFYFKRAARKRQTNLRLHYGVKGKIVRVVLESEP